MSGIQYTEQPGTAPTPDVSIAYEPLANSVFMRTTGVSDSTGTWYETYSYVPLNPNDTVFGDGQLATVTTQSLHTVSYTYDMLGRVSTTGLEVAGVNIGDTTSTWDDLGRLTHLTNPLGTEEIHYDGNTGRVSWSKIAGLKTTYGYDATVPGEHRLASIQSTWNEAWNEYTNHSYGYDAVGRLTNWTRNQMPSNTGKIWAMGYDASEQLETVGVTRLDANTPDPIEDDLHFYQYDASGNRTSEQRGGVVRSWGANAFNQLTDQQLGGPMELRGGAGVQSNVTVTPVNEAGTATGPAQTATPPGGATTWKTRVNAGLGMNRYKVEATQAQVPAGTVPQTTTRTLAFPLGSELPATFSYDLDGNMLSDGVRSYTWDAENRLVKVTGSAFGEVEFTYDPFHRRSRIVEKWNAQVVSDRLLRWEGLAIIGERIATSTSTEDRYYYGNGESRKVVGSSGAPLKLLYTVDHLGSIRELVDATTGLVRARYDYSPYGIRTKQAGDLDTEFGYTGHYTNARSGLVLAPYRAYDPVLGRWISRDPIEEDGGINLYGYVGNGPQGAVDPLGLETISESGSMKVDTDGTGSDHGNPYHQSQTSYCNPDGSYLNADIDIYIVAPLSFRAKGVRAGDKATVTAGGRSVTAIIGDFGPSARGVGEISVAAIYELGYTIIHKRSGPCPGTVTEWVVDHTTQSHVPVVSDADIQVNVTIETSPKKPKSSPTGKPNKTKKTKK